MTASFIVPSQELRPLGIGLYPHGGAMANHCCRPNALQCFRGSSLQLRWDPSTVAGLLRRVAVGALYRDTLCLKSAR